MSLDVAKLENNLAQALGGPPPASSSAAAKRIAVAFNDYALSAEAGTAFTPTGRELKAFRKELSDALKGGATAPDIAKALVGATVKYWKGAAFGQGVAGEPPAEVAGIPPPTAQAIKVLTKLFARPNESSAVAKGIATALDTLTKTIPVTVPGSPPVTAPIT